MSRFLYALLSALLVCTLLNTSSARKSYSSRHSYPKSGGLSGGGGHHYPSSGGLSGGGHGYPSSGSHGYPSSGGHGYPPSGGLSGSGGHGYPSSSNGHTYPSSSNGHTYPSSGGLSGGGSGYPNTHHTSGQSYPGSKGLSGNTPSSTVNVHHHYHYSPPQQISYTPRHGGPPMHYPVYQGSPPSYVYQYKNSGSKYGTLLAGLALFNLGALAGGIYGHSKSHSDYKPQPGEVCKFAVKKENGDYEETKIDCQLITSFIFAEQAKASNSSGGTNTTIVTTTTTNVTIVNGTIGSTETTPEPTAFPMYAMLPNGTLVPLNSTTSINETNVANSTGQGNNTDQANNPSTVITTTVTNTTTVVNALEVKGSPVEVTPGMKCYVMRHSPTSNMRKSVPCGLLQTYAEKSLKKNSGYRNAPTATLLGIVIATFILVN